MKVSPEEKELIRKDYSKFRAVGMTKTEARAATSKKHDRGLTTIWDNTFDMELSPVEEAGRTVSVEWPKTYIFTGWEIRVGVEPAFIETLEVIAQHYNAEIIIVPCKASDVSYMPQELKDKFTVLTKDVRLNDNLLFKYVETNALAQSPLAGHVGAYPETSTIIPGLVKELRTEPSHNYVKQLVSTGSIGYLNATFGIYEDLEDKAFDRRWRTTRAHRHGKGTAIARNYVQPSALIVDVLDKKTFLTRFITSHSEGIVYDLNKKFTSKGVEKYQPSALVTGDFHAYYKDDGAVKATKDMIRLFDPKEVVVQDFFDGASVNYHVVGSAVNFSTAPSIEDEARLSRELLTELCRMSNKVVYLQSNHDNFLYKYLDTSETLWRMNNNYKSAVELQLYRAEQRKHPIIKLLDLESYDNLEFVSERDNYTIEDVLIKHGHEGISGARSGFLAQAKVYNYFVCGHFHAPGVFRNAMCVGLLGDLTMEYVLGANGMLHANGLIHADNSVQLLNIIKGEWIR